MHTFDLSLKEITKVQGAASLELRVQKGKVEHVHLKMVQAKRFYTQGMRGKNMMILPQFLARICGTCSNAHLVCSIEACEKALGIKPSSQTMLMRFLTTYALMIRDHALHLYLFVLPDIFAKDSLLEFDESDPLQHQTIHDAFNIKAAGNYLSAIIAGRSVHAPYPTIGGFLHFPAKEEIKRAINQLKAIRPAVLRLIDILAKAPFHFDRKTNYMALVADQFGFLEGSIVSSRGDYIPEEKFAEHLEHVVLPYSQASGYVSEKESYMVGALARINLAKDRLHRQTKKSLPKILNLFPSTDIFHNNLAQAIEILHSVDHSIEILTENDFPAEPVIKKSFHKGTGIGVIEAPRGTLYHKVVVDDEGKVTGGELVIPTAQNQINIERDIAVLVESLLPRMSKKEIVFEIEKLIRAYDPCMSCATHFLEVKWKQ